MSRILFLCFFLLTNASQDNSVKLEAYIAELFELKVLDESELRKFLYNLEKNLILNPIDCKAVHCNSIKSMYRGELEAYLEKDLNLSHIQMSIRKLLEDKTQNDKDREETKQETKAIWRGHIYQRIAGNSFQTCAINKDHKVVCWGSKTQMPESKTNILMPKEMGPVKELCASENQNSNPHIFALEKSGKVHGWGYYRYKEHLKLSNIVQITSGLSGNYALRNDGTANFWGNWIEKWFGYSISNHNKILELSTGSQHLCAVMEDMSAECWGSNSQGQLNVPTNFDFVESIAAGVFHTCALQKNGQVRCWGFDGPGRSTPPSDLSPVVQIAVNGYGSCALQKNGIAKCWGELSVINSQLLALGPLVQISLNFDQVCTVKRDAKVHCLVLTFKNYQAYFKEDSFPPDKDMEVYIEDLLPRFEF